MASRERPIVVYCDDDPSMRTTLEMYIEAFAQFEMKCFESAEELFAFIEENPFDIILTDYIMGGMDGIALVRKLRKDPRFERVPIIVFSGHEHIAPIVTKAGAMYAQKPDPARVLELLGLAAKTLEPAAVAS